MDARGVMGSEADPGDDGARGAALQRLNTLHKAIGSAVTKEATAMARIFPHSANALPAFVTRLFEQRLKVPIPWPPFSISSASVLLHTLPV